MPKLHCGSSKELLKVKRLHNFSVQNILIFQRVNCQNCKLCKFQAIIALLMKVMPTWLNKAKIVPYREKKNIFGKVLCSEGTEQS